MWKGKLITFFYQTAPILNWRSRCGVSSFTQMHEKEVGLPCSPARQWADEKTHTPCVGILSGCVLGCCTWWWISFLFLNPQIIAGCYLIEDYFGFGFGGVFCCCLFICFVLSLVLISCNYCNMLLVVDSILGLIISICSFSLCSAGGGT